MNRTTHALLAHHLFPNLQFTISETTGNGQILSAMVQRRTCWLCDKIVAIHRYALEEQFSRAEQKPAKSSVNCLRLIHSPLHTVSGKFSERFSLDPADDCDAEDCDKRYQHYTDSLTAGEAESQAQHSLSHPVVQRS